MTGRELLTVLALLVAAMVLPVVLRRWFDRS